MLERLQKIIARAGIASRRHAEELIKSGLVTVNGQTITELGSKADESTDHIKVQGKLLRPQTERIYLLLHKPPEVVSTMIDPEGRRTLTDLLYGVSQRVFPVGRLEYHSMGLVFLTNDGELANQMLKAHQLQQTYQLKLKTLLTFEEIEALSRSTGAQISRLKGKDAPWYEVTLSEARRDALRNRLFQTGHPVEKIKRIKIGNLAMESLSTGHHRPLSDAEVATLRKLVQSDAAQPAAAFAAPENQEAPQPLQFRHATPVPAAAAMPPRPPMQAPRRPFVKRRPYQPKPKPGERPRPTYDATRTDSAPPGQSFRPTRPSEARPATRVFARIKISKGKDRAQQAPSRSRARTKTRAPQHPAVPVSKRAISGSQTSTSQISTSPTSRRPDFNRTTVPRAARNPQRRGVPTKSHPSQERSGAPTKISAPAARPDKSPAQNPAPPGNQNSAPANQARSDAPNKISSLAVHAE